MQTYTTRDGVEHPIRDGFLLYPPGWTQEAEDAALIAWRTGEELNPVDRQYLDAWTNRGNLESAWKWLAGDYREHGFETLCQVHGQAWSPDVCGCTVHQVWDHHTRDEPAGITVKSHRIHKLCDRHASVAHPDRHAEHHDRLVAECQHKEAVLTAVTGAHGLTVDDRPAWHFNKDHELVIDTTGHRVLTAQHVNRIVREQFAPAVVHVR